MCVPGCGWREGARFGGASVWLAARGPGAAEFSPRIFLQGFVAAHVVVAVAPVGFGRVTGKQEVSWLPWRRAKPAWRRGVPLADLRCWVPMELWGSLCTCTLLLWQLSAPRCPAPETLAPALPPSCLPSGGWLLEPQPQLCLLPAPHLRCVALRAAQVSIGASLGAAEAEPLHPSAAQL